MAIVLRSTSKSDIMASYYDSTKAGMKALGPLRRFASIQASAALSFLLFMFASCRNEEDIQGLMGQWQLEEYHSDDGTQGPSLGRQWYLSFAGHTAWVKEVEAASHEYQSVFAACDIRSDSLLMEFTLRYGHSDTLLVERTMHFPSFGHSSLGMQRIDDNTLMLQSGSRVWRWKRY